MKQHITDMLSVLRDPLWQFVGAVIAVMALLVGIWTNSRQSRKSLSYSLLVPSLVSVDQRIRGQVEILLDGKPIGAPSLLLLRITNTGNLPIRAGDFDKPLVATVNGNIISVSVVDTYPQELREYLDWQQHSSQIEFEKVLLNRGDWFEVQILATELASRKPLVLQGRIAGIESIARRDYRERTSFSISRPQRAVVS